MFLRIAFNNLWRNKRRTLFTELAIVFGIVVIIFTGAFLKGMFRGWVLMQSEASLGSFQVEHRDYREQNILDPLGVSLENAESIIQSVEEVPGVIAAFGELKITGIVGTGSKSATFSGKGVDKEGQRRTLTTAKDLIRDGRGLGDDPSEIVLGQFLAEMLEVEVGEQVAIVVQTLKGGIDMMYGTVVGVKNGNHFPSASYLEMSLERAQKFLRMPDRVSHILVRGDDFYQFLDYAGTVETTLQQAGLPVIVRDHTELIQQYATSGGAFTLIAVVVSLILFIIVGGGIANAMFMAVRERKKEIGTLLAIGMEPSQTRRLFILEGILVGLLGAIIGVVLVLGAIQLIVTHGGIPLYFEAIDETSYIFPEIDWFVVSMAFIMSFAVSTIASWFPASASAKLNPVEALTEM